MRLEQVKAYIITVFALMSLAGAAHAGHVAASRGEYVPAEPIAKRGPSYPLGAAYSGHEGWVLLSYIVSTNGHVKDVMIEDSTGDKELERAAVRAAKTWSYKPAMLNGKPVEESMVHTRVTFTLGNSPKGATAVFAGSFARAERAIRSGELDEAKKILDGPQLTDRENLYEDAWFWWLKYEYLFAVGHSTSDQLMACLHKAVGYQEGDGFKPKSLPIRIDSNYLPPEIFVAAAARLFVLQAQALDLSGAIRTFDALSSSASARKARTYSEAVKQLKPIYVKIKSIIRGDRILEMRAHVGEFGDWIHQLVRRSFSVGNIKGHLAALEVRCKRGTEAFAATGSKTYTIPESWGSCSVYVKGDEGATFALYQYPKKRE